MKKGFFYIKKWKSIRTEEEIDISFVPALERRKLGLLDKLTLSTMGKVYNDKIEEIVFSSKSGEAGRLDKLIEQRKELGEISPAQFSGSVHNFPPGFFTLLKKVNIPYYALSAGENSFSAGLIKSVISDKNNVLYTYTDKESFSCVVSKNEGRIKLNLYDILKVKTPDDLMEILAEEKRG